MGRMADPRHNVARPLCLESLKLLTAKELGGFFPPADRWRESGTQVVDPERLAPIPGTPDAPRWGYWARMRSTVPGSSGKIPASTSRGTTSRQTGSAANTFANSGSEASTRPVVTRVAACQNVTSAISGA